MMSRKPQDTFSGPRQGSRTRFLARRACTLAMAGALVVVPMITGFPQFSAPAQAHPVTSTLRRVGFVKTSLAAVRVGPDATRPAPRRAAPDPTATARAAAVTPVQEVAGPVTVVGVTWPRGSTSAGNTYQIRTLTGGAWSQWQPMADEGDGPDRTEAATATQGTSPFVVAGASRYQVRLLASDAKAPIAATVQAVDPGTSGADAIQQEPGGASAAARKPTIYSRAQWGANESIRRAIPSYGRIMLGFVHHTDTPNGYPASSVPSIIRGMYAYHVNSLGWSDIGYNFIVDRFGRIWEGRYGGVSRAVVGAQTLNFNSVSMGVSAIGTYNSTAVPQAMTNAFKAIFAWKFSLAGIPATGTVVANGRTLNRVSGHRDGFSTDCPGNYLYAKLPEIRAGASSILASRPPVIVGPPVTVIRSVIRRDVAPDGVADALSYRPGPGGMSISGATSLLASTAGATVTRGVTIGSGWNSLRNASLSPDLNGDGRADIIALDPAADRLRIYLGNGKGGFAGVLYRGPGWNGMSRVIAAGDRNRDGRNDILATKKSGELVYYAGNGAAGLSSGRIIGAGWGIFSTITSAGDLNGDGYPDLLAKRTRDGALMMYAGAAGGSLQPGVLWGSGWGSMSPVIGGADLDGDRYPDVMARLGDGMRTYSTGAGGRFTRITTWGSGWRGLTQLSTGADWNGDGAADLLAVNPSVSGGTLSLFAGVGHRGFSTRPGAFPTVPGADLVRLVGDVNGDGYPDAVARVRTTNTLVILLGQSGSGFAAPRQIGSGWNAFPLLEAAGDYSGDGVPDLLIRDAAGSLFVYPFTRSLTFGTRLKIGAGFQGMRSMAGTGAFDADVYGDVVGLRASDHALVLFRGTGSRALLAGTVLAGAQNDLAQVLGVGDFNGGGTADLLARSNDGRLWLYPGNGLGGLGARQLVRGGEGAGHVLG